jgi:transposase
MRVIALDVHRSFAEVAVHEEGLARPAGRIVLEHDAVVKFARSLRRDDHVVLEATGNTAAIVRLLTPHTRRVAVANPRLVRLIAEAKVKTDKIDAKILAQLYAAGFLPEVWLPDEAAELRRRLVAQRAQVVAHMTRLKNRVHSVLHANLIPATRASCSPRPDGPGSTRKRCRRTKGWPSAVIWTSSIILPRT